MNTSLRALQSSVLNMQATEVIPQAPKPTVSAKKSLSDSEIVCLSCGKGSLSLKRHIKSSHQMSPDEYRAHWTLPGDYPMFSPE